MQCFENFGGANAPNAPLVARLPGPNWFSNETLARSELVHSSLVEK